MSKHTDEELRIASDHLYYEIWMMRRLGDILKRGNIAVSVIKPVTHTDTADSSFSAEGISHTAASETIDAHEKARVINNALIEAFAIHVRALLDFFYRQGEEDDVVAEQYFHTLAEWQRIRPPKTKDELNKIRGRVNKEIAHLTYARQKVTSKEWPLVDLLEEVDAMCDVFVRSVPPKLLGARWKQGNP